MPQGNKGQKISNGILISQSFNLDFPNMAIRVVEFSNGGYKIRKILPTNQHTQRKILNFENWVNWGLRNFQKSEF